MAVTVIVPSVVEIISFVLVGVYSMKKIMFNSKYGLDNAVLEGRKTMTRRIIPNRVEVRESGYNACGFCDENDRDVKPVYKVGEVIAIAQSYKDCGYDMELIIDGKLMYKHPGWNNKMFVKAELMKQFIKITNVKVERLQDITGEDCLKEGVEEHLKGVQYGFPSNIGYVGQYPFSTPREAFAGLIDRVSGKGTWESNPWVWVYEFELTDNTNKS